MKAKRSCELPAPFTLDLPKLTPEFCCRVSLVVAFATFAHQTSWEWLRFLTSECVLRISAALSLTTSRICYDTIVVGRQATQFVIACTFVDVFMGSIPLVWNLNNSVLKNIFWLFVIAVLLFGFNLMRLEFAQILYYRGITWVVADGVLGGVAYFVVWIAIWRLRSWEIWARFSQSVQAKTFAPFD